MSAQPVVYFLQPRGGGPIKVGKTSNLSARLSGLNGWSPSGLELLATIPGADVREASIKWLFTDRRWNAQEWFAPNSTIWRVIIEAQEVGDLSWLPAEPPPLNWHDRRRSREVYREAIAYFGSRAALAQRLGYKLVSTAGLASEYGVAAPNLIARFEIERLRDAGALPAYLCPAAPAIKDAA